MQKNEESEGAVLVDKMGIKTHIRSHIHLSYLPHCLFSLLFFLSVSSLFSLFRMMVMAMMPFVFLSTFTYYYYL